MFLIKSNPTYKDKIKANIIGAVISVQPNVQHKVKSNDKSLQFNFDKAVGSISVSGLFFPNRGFLSVLLRIQSWKWYQGL